MLNIHVGQGITRGPLTVFPLWKDYSGQVGPTTSTDHLQISETKSGPQVNTLVVGNPGDRPTLILEGQLFEGGWQHRMATRTMVVGVHQQIDLDVACVEQGRWQGDTRQMSRGRRATPWIREAIRGGGDVQQTVWDRVGRRTENVHNPTQSLVRRLDVEEAGEWADLRPLPGQSGVLVAAAGQPLTAEMFATPRELRSQWESLLAAAAMDARALPTEVTPDRRAHRFVQRFMQLTPSARRDAGVGVEVSGRSEFVDASVVSLKDQPVHVRISNVRHPLLAGV